MQTARKSIGSLYVGLLVLLLVLPWIPTRGRSPAESSSTPDQASPGQGKGHAKGAKAQKAENEDEDRDRGERGAKLPVFGTHEREIIAAYYRNRNSNLPPGLAKRGGNLPPGLERQLQRKGKLPPGLQKRLEPFPPDLVRSLPPLPPDYNRGVIGAHVVLVNRRTGIIVDVIKNIALARR